LVIPHIDEDFAVEAMKKLIEIEKDWVPSEPGTSLYVRPFIISTEPYLGVAPSKTYSFMIIYHQLALTIKKVSIQSKLLWKILMYVQYLEEQVKQKRLETMRLAQLLQK